MKLSQYAKKIDVTYLTAYNHFNKGLIPNSYKLPNGTIIIEDIKNNMLYKINSGSFHSPTISCSLTFSFK
jgi:predicted site-specific integrase-resolvase